MGILKTLAVVTATLLPISAGAQTFDIGNMNDEQRSIFRDEVRAYLLDNPTVLVEAMNVLEQQQQDLDARADQLMLQQNAKELWDDGISYVDGNPDGDLVMVEFMDYRCSYCRKAHNEIKELLKTDGNIKLIIKEYPILGNDSTVSTKMAVAALQLFGDEAYDKLYNDLMSFNGPMNEKTIRMVAHRNGLDSSAILARMDGPEVAEHIARMHELGRKMRISGTPTFVVGGSILRGYVPLKSMRAIVAAERKISN